MALWPMGGQITESTWLLRHTREYERYLKHLVTEFPDCQDAVSWLLELADSDDVDRKIRSMFLNATQPSFVKNCLCRQCLEPVSQVLTGTR